MPEANIMNWPKSDDEKLVPEDIAHVLCARLEELADMKIGYLTKITIEGLKVEGRAIGDYIVTVERTG